MSYDPSHDQGEIGDAIEQAVSRATEPLERKIASVQRDNSAIADQIIALNNQIHVHLVEGGFITPIDPPHHVVSVLALLKQIDKLVLQLDRGSGHVGMQIG